MRVPRWLAALPFSLVVHAVIVVAAVALLRTESLPALILDLNAMIVGRDDGPAAGSGSPADARASSGAGGPSPAPRAATVAPTRSLAPSRTAPAAPDPPAALVPPEPARPAAPELVSSTRPEPRPPRAADPVSAAAPDARAAPSPPTSSPSVPTSGPDPSGTRATGQGTADAAASTSGSGSGPASGSGTGRAGGGQTAAVAPDAGGVGAGIGSEYSAYYAQLRQRVQEGLRYPPMARRRGVTGTVQLEIAVAIDGGIADVSVIGSSSHEILDRAAVDAARSVLRLPFPPDVQPRPLQVRLPVVFQLQ